MSKVTFILAKTLQEQQQVAYGHFMVAKTGGPLVFWTNPKKQIQDVKDLLAISSRTVVQVTVLSI